MGNVILFPTTTTRPQMDFKPKLYCRIYAVISDSIVQYEISCNDEEYIGTTSYGYFTSYQGNGLSLYEIGHSDGAKPAFILPELKSYERDQVCLVLPGLHASSGEFNFPASSVQFHWRMPFYSRLLHDFLYLDGSPDFEPLKIRIKGGLMLGLRFHQNIYQTRVYKDVWSNAIENYFDTDLMKTVQRINSLLTKDWINAKI